MTHHLRRLIIIGTLLGIGIALGWYGSQPKSIPIRVQTVERGVTESTVANTRAGTVESCQRGRPAGAIAQQKTRRRRH